jgi:hypothetical protein
MIGLLPIMLSFMLFVVPEKSSLVRREFVPDEKTAVRIAEAVLVGQYGKKSTNAQLPLLIQSVNEECWCWSVGGMNKDKEGRAQTKGAVNVFIDKHTGGLSVYKEWKPNRRDYVPDEKTAARIAEAVLVGQYGQERVNSQLPLFVKRMKNVDHWLVEGNGKTPGGNFGVVINKHTGCIDVVMEKMR